MFQAIMPDRGTNGAMRFAPKSAHAWESSKQATMYHREWHRRIEQSRVQPWRLREDHTTGGVHFDGDGRNARL